MFSLIPWRKKKEESRSVAPRGGHPLARLRDDFDELFDRFLSRWPAPFEPGFGLAPWGFDVEDREQEVVIRAEAPGFEAGDFDVHVSGQALIIRAEQRHDRKDGEGAGRYEEHAYRTFRRTVTLPRGIDPDRIEARYRNGVLEVRVPRTEEARGKRVAVKAG